MNLDDLARSATEDLLERTSPAPGPLLEGLKRTRRRREAERAAAVALAVAVAVGSWTLLRGSDPTPEPTGPVVRNGAIVTGGDTGAWRVVDGELTHVPTDVQRFGHATFTPDGSELVYPNRQKQLVALDVEQGTTRTLVPCPARTFCDGSLSPDGIRVAMAGDDGLEIYEVGSDEAVALPTPGVSPIFPRWSPDGTTIAFLGGQGLYVVDADGSNLRTVHRWAGGSPATRSPRAGHRTVSASRSSSPSPAPAATSPRIPTSPPRSSGSMGRTCGGCTTPATASAPASPRRRWPGVRTGRRSPSRSRRAGQARGSTSRTPTAVAGG